jgi:hypothetical protein
MNDYIIIGAGISGLYTAYNIRKKNPNAKITILEKERIGGRMGLKDFYGVPVPIGAGVGRENDKLLFQLLKELNISVKKISDSSFLTFKGVNIITELKLLRDYYTKLKLPPNKKNPTFKQFAKKILQKKYKLFVESAGFSDYENEDIKRTLYNYNMEDNAWSGNKYLINWNLLLDKLVQFVKSDIKIEEVKSITKPKIDNSSKSNCITVKTSKRIYHTNKLIIATTASTLHKLIPGYEYVCGQPFLRLFAKFNDSAVLVHRMKEINTHCIITDCPLQKILPMDIEKGIYMISYSDNKQALALRPYINNTNKNRKHIEKLFNDCIFLDKKDIELPTIKEIWGKFWDIGTHYFKPTLKKVNQMPFDNIFIVGEMISEHQGWTEGALDSVEKIKHLII